MAGCFGHHVVIILPSFCGDCNKLLYGSPDPFKKTASIMESKSSKFDSVGRLVSSTRLNFSSRDETGPDGLGDRHQRFAIGVVALITKTNFDLPSPGFKTWQKA